MGSSGSIRSEMGPGIRNPGGMDYKGRMHIR